VAGATTFGKKSSRALGAAYVSPSKEVSVSAVPAFPFALSSIETGLPLVTISILVLMVLIFACEVEFSPVRGSGWSIPLGDTIAFGANGANLFFHQGQWWRMFTAPLLHGSLMHVVGNGICFGIIGVMLEPLIGSRWFAALFAVGAIGGSIGSLIFLPAGVSSVGASGAIMGVLAAAFVCGMFAGENGPSLEGGLAGRGGWSMQTWALVLLLPALLPMTVGSHTDLGAHLGGVVVGALCGVAMEISWTDGEPHPAFGNVVILFAIAWFVVALGAFALFAQRGNAAMDTTPGMIPDAQLPRTLDVGHDSSVDFVTRYPSDPRAHLFRAIAFIRANDLTDAEDQLRAALALKRKIDPDHIEDFQKVVDVFLALTLSYEGKVDEAKAIGAPLCDFAQLRLKDNYQLMQTRGICPLA